MMPPSKYHRFFEQTFQQFYDSGLGVLEDGLRLQFYSLLQVPTASVTTLAGLYDVQLTAPATGDHLVFQGGLWINQVPSASISNHASLLNLAYAVSGHVGFAGTGVVNQFAVGQQFQADIQVSGSILASGKDVFIYNPLGYNTSTIFAFGSLATVRSAAFSESPTSAWAMGQENETVVQISGATNEPVFGLYNRAFIPATASGSFGSVCIGTTNIAANFGPVLVTGDLIAESNQVRFDGATNHTTNAYGQQIFVGLSIAAPATLTNAYGTYYFPIKNAQITNAFALYQEGAEDINYFGGRVGIHTTNPTDPWHVVGTTRLEGNVQASGSIASTKRITSNVSTLVDAEPIVTDASLGNLFIHVGSVSRTIAAPADALDGQKVMWRFKNSGTGSVLHTLTTGSVGAFRFGDDVTALTVIVAGKTDYLGAVYNASDSFWDVIAYTKGF